MQVLVLWISPWRFDAGGVKSVWGGMKSVWGGMKSLLGGMKSVCDTSFC